MAGDLELLADGGDAGCILLRRDRLIEDVIFLPMEIHATEAVLQIFAERAEFALAAVVTMEKEIAVVIQRRVNALVTQLVLKTDRVIATVLVAVRFNTEEAIFAGEGIVAPVAVAAFRKMIPDAVFAAELVNGQVRRLGA